MKRKVVSTYSEMKVLLQLLNSLSQFSLNLTSNSEIWQDFGESRFFKKIITWEMNTELFIIDGN